MKERWSIRGSQLAHAPRSERTSTSARCRYRRRAEPIQGNPVIIEDNCFIGARSEIVEGVIVEENSVISMGVFISQSTKIFDRETGEITTVGFGWIGRGPGNLPSRDGSHSLYCAVIVKKVDAQTRAKTSLNELLRD